MASADSNFDATLREMVAELKENTKTAKKYAAADKEDKVEEEKEIKEEEEVKEIKEEEEVKEIKKGVKEIQLYTIDEVLEQDEWIIIEVDGKKNIYDLSKWIQHHPGGDAIFQGIEANNHYKNKKLYPDSPTELFDGIHYHHEEGAFEKYFKNKNEYVELVGRLK